MSIADKLIYLNTTKEKLKDSINNIGGSITDETTFRAYATELDNIYDNLPKTTGEGSNLSLTTLKGKLNIEAYKGDTSQDTYEGYNLLPTTISQSTHNGITIQKQTDGSYKVTGTATGNAILYILNESDNITLPSGSYYISGCPSGGTSETYRLVISVGGTLYGEYGSGRAITTNASGTLSAYIYVGTGTTINLTYYPMLTSGSTQKPYQKYVGGTASPNPTYPQDINVVTGTQEVVVQNKNLCDGQFRQGGWHDSSAPTRLFTTQNLVVEKGKTYTISTTLDTTRYKYGIAVGKLPYPQTTNPNIYDSGWSTTSSKTITFNVSGYDIGYLGITIATANGTDSLTPSDIEGVEWQVEYGSTAKPYTPHQEQTNIVNLSSKNLLDISTFAEHYTIGTNGLPSYNAGQTRITNLTPINVEGIDKVTLTCTLNGKSFIYSLLQADNTLISRVAGNPSGTTITIGEAKYLYICFYDNATLSNITDAMLNEGSTATTYEPYYNYELSKIGTYKNRIFETSGKNLFNPDVTSLYTAGCNVTESGGEITITATRNGDIYVGNVRASGGTYVADRGVKIPVAPLTSYILSFTNSNVNKLFITEYDSNNISLGYVQANTITTQANTSYITIRYGLENATSGTSYKTKIMLNLGSTALPYEPYGSDKWYLEKNIGKKDDIKATDFSLYNQSVANNIYQFRTANQYLPSVQLTPDPFNIEDIAYSNYFLKKAGINNLDNYYFTITGNGALAINVPCANATRLAEWMNGKTIEVYYQMATPTYTEITNETLIEELNELEKMMSYNGQTNISISGNLPMILDVSALKGE